jgi:hypothetical protein
MPRRSHERQRLLATYGKFYSKHFFEKHPEERYAGCYYCGELCDNKDHVPPLNWIESQRVAEWIKRGYELLLVKSCASCNSLLGDKPLFTLADRAQHVAEELEKKYERDSALWSNEEIKEMSPLFQRMIRARKEAVQGLLRRIRHSQWRAINP